MISDQSGCPKWNIVPGTTGTCIWFGATLSNTGTKTSGVINAVTALPVSMLDLGSSLLTNSGLIISIADPGSGIQAFFDPPDPESGTVFSGSRIKLHEIIKS
jgi:hypothetical protein